MRSRMGSYLSWAKERLAAVNQMNVDAAAAEKS
jgi:hypothetical protein